MTAYYNEIDPFAAAWLKNLIAAGHIAKGEVDTRSISDVTPGDLNGFTQCHFFAGIGVWSYALRLAQWPDTRPVWTGSCPCQPFSVAGKSAGMHDERHLWPHWHWLIQQCKPAVIFGEQVDAAIGHGWLDLVQADLEGINYSFAPVSIPAGGVGAPHIRQRLWFVGHSSNKGLEERFSQPGVSRCEAGTGQRQAAVGAGVCTSCMDNAISNGRGALGNDDTQHDGQLVDAAKSIGDRPCQDYNHWRDADWLLCRDGKWRPVEPGTFPLAHGATQRVGRLRAYGNAIVPQVAAQVISAYMECRP